MFFTQPTLLLPVFYSNSILLHVDTIYTVQGNINHSTQLISQKKWSTSQKLKWLTVKSGSGWRSEEGEEGGQRDEGVEEACRDEQHHQLGGQVIIVLCKATSP